MLFVDVCCDLVNELWIGVFDDDFSWFWCGDCYVGWNFKVDVVGQVQCQFQSVVLYLCMIININDFEFFFEVFGYVGYQVLDDSLGYILLLMCMFGYVVRCDFNSVVFDSQSDIIGCGEVMGCFWVFNFDGLVGDRGGNVCWQFDWFFINMRYLVFFQKIV